MTKEQRVAGNGQRRQFSTWDVWGRLFFFSKMLRRYEIPRDIGRTVQPTERDICIWLSHFTRRLSNKMLKYIEQFKDVLFLTLTMFIMSKILISSYTSMCS